MEIPSFQMAAVRAVQKERLIKIAQLERLKKIFNKQQEEFKRKSYEIEKSINDTEEFIMKTTGSKIDDILTLKNLIQ